MPLIAIITVLCFFGLATTIFLLQMDRKRRKRDAAEADLRLKHRLIVERRDDGIGRHPGLKIPCSERGVRVRPPLPAIKKGRRARKPKPMIEKPKPSEFFFIKKDNKAYIVNKKFWEEHKSVDESMSAAVIITRLLPAGFKPMGNAWFACYNDKGRRLGWKRTKELLHDEGFTMLKSDNNSIIHK